MNKIITSNKSEVIRLNPQHGRAYSRELRSRTMQLLAAGKTPNEIAYQLKISERTVFRYAKASQEQQRLVPIPKRSGRWRHGLMDRKQMIEIGSLLLQT